MGNFELSFYSICSGGDQRKEESLDRVLTCEFDKLDVLKLEKLPLPRDKLC